MNHHVRVVGFDDLAEIRVTNGHSTGEIGLFRGGYYDLPLGSALCKMVNDVFLQDLIMGKSLVSGFKNVNTVDGCRIKSGMTGEIWTARIIIN